MCNVSPEYHLAISEGKVQQRYRKLEVPQLSMANLWTSLTKSLLSHLDNCMTMNISSSAWKDLVIKVIKSHASKHKWIFCSS